MTYLTNGDYADLKRTRVIDYLRNFRTLTEKKGPSMNKSLPAILSVLAVIAFGGCQKPGPIEVIDPSLQSQSLELDNGILTSPELFGITGADSGRIYPVSRFFAPDQPLNPSQFLVAGVRYDALLSHHEASLARAVIFDRSQRVIAGRDTVYRTIDPGTVRLDGLALYQYPQRFAIRSTSRDTLLGVQYALLSKDGVGGRGFRYSGTHFNQWESSGSQQLPPFSLTCVSAPELYVTAPTPRDVVAASQNLQVRWEGGSSSIRVIISSLQPAAGPKPIFQMRVSSNRGGVVLPSAVLGILPRDQSSFLFSFISDSTVTTRISGYPDPVPLQTVFVHNLVLQVSH